VKITAPLFLVNYIQVGLKGQMAGVYFFVGATAGVKERGFSRPVFWVKDLSKSKFAFIMHLLTFNRF